MFKDKFKYYKRKNEAPDFSDVINYGLPHDKVIQFQVANENVTTEGTGLKPPDKWRVFEVIGHPGLLIVENPFYWHGQRFWIKKCLQDFSKPPNVSNLSQLKVLSKYDDWWDLCQKDPVKKVQLHKKMRWITLGYHHNWDTKEYSEDHKNEFPSDLNNLVKIIAKVVGGWDFNSEAAILNLYYPGTVMSGHKDVSEPFMEAPIFSFSFGQSAIFIIGGEQETDSTSAVALNSGDIMIMSGKSRSCYHGVPRVFLTEKRPWEKVVDDPECPIDSDEDCWKPFDDFISYARININVRQVLKPSQNTL